MQKDHALFVVQNQKDASILAAVERALAEPASPLDALPTLTNVALADLHAQYPLRPPPSRGLLARLRTRLAWWLLGPELAQLNATHATLVRLADSLVVQLDEERSARRRIEDHLAQQ